MVVHSRGLDEISTAGPTQIAELKDGQIHSQELNPADLGIAPANLEDLRVDGPQQSAATLRAILEGKDKGPKRDIIALNAAGAIMVGGLAPDFKVGLSLAAASIDDGKALACLETLIKVSNS
jgi:anthranilate phosphoribosyltransferase